MAIKTIEQFRAEATSEIEAQKPMHGQSTDKGRYELSDADYEIRIEDLAQWNFDKQNNGYKSARLESYGSIGDQLDLLYHDMTAGKGDKTGEWYKAVKKVKDDNPKPS
tara:strand:+ start:141 stop:464 length:324 start_codon:yes stop_codon:yes gene_type:complete